MIRPTNITVTELRSQRIIYIRYRGSYVEFRKASRKLFKELFDFAAENKVIIPNEAKAMIIYDDNPFITGERVCVQVSP